MAVKTIASANPAATGVTNMKLTTGQHVNTGVTASDAPVLLTVQADEVIDASTFAKLVADANTDLSNAFVVRMLNLLNETVADIIETATAAPNIDFGWAKFLFEISGSLDTATETPGVDNYCYFSGTVKSEYQRKFAQMSAYASSAEQPCDLKRIRDKATADLNKIYGTDTFFIDGRGLSYGHTGESCALYDALGVTKQVDITIDSQASYSTSIKASLPATKNLSVGKYMLKMVSIINGMSYPMTKEVTLAEAIVANPSLTTVQQGDKAAGTACFGQGAANAVTISGIVPGGFKTGDVLRLDSLNADGSVYTTMTATDQVTASTESSITLGNGLDNASPKPDGDWEGKQARFVLVRDGGEFGVTFTYG